jgi:hypothetical protein
MALPPDDPTSFTRSYSAENWHRTWRDWEDRQNLVGFALLVLAFLGYGVISQDPTMAKIGIAVAAAYLAVRVCVITPRAMWNDSRRAINGYRDRLTPRMSFVFDPDNIPYLQHFPLSGAPAGIGLRMYRVGIRNESAEIINHVRVVVESVAFMMDGVECPPTTDHPIPIEHALNVMAIDSKDGMVNLAPGDKPTAYIDVVEQLTDSQGLPHDRFSFCYATRHRVPLQLLSTWSVWLRVEGGGTYARQRFLISREEGVIGKMLMMPHGLG